MELVDLRTHREPLLRFLETELEAFRTANPSVSVGHVALYSCPWSGWVALSLDSARQPDQNCPDFEHAEVGVYDAPEWSSEYEEASQPRITLLDGRVVEPDVEHGGDEAYNQVFFHFLCDVLQSAIEGGILEMGSGPRPRVGVQMLDSEFTRSW